MRTLTSTLLSAQKAASREPSLQLTARQFGHPAKASLVRQSMFDWTKVYSDATPAGQPCLGTDGQGNLHWFYKPPNSSNIYWKKITNPTPSSDFSGAWTQLAFSTEANTPFAAAVLGANISVWSTGPQTTLRYIESTDYGANWAWNVHPANISGEDGLAVIWKDASTLTLCYSTGNSGAISVLERVNGTWGYVGMHALVGWYPDVLCMYFDGDYNIIAMVTVGTTIRLARIVLGQGGALAHGTWSDVLPIATYKAEVDYTTATKIIPGYENAFSPSFWTNFSGWLFPKAPQRGGYIRTWPTPLPVAGEQSSRESMTATYQIRAIDNLDLQTPSILKPSSGPPIMFFNHLGDRWFYRLNPAGTFIDAHWNKACKIVSTECNYGFAMAEAGGYLWGVRSNEVWYSYGLPGSCWLTPTIGSGAAAGSETIDQARIMSLEENIYPLRTSKLKAVLDNADGEYSALPTTHIKRGSQLELAYGYKTPSAERTGGNKYFIESFEHSRDANRATVTLECIDAWGLLAEYTIPGPQEYNLGSNTHHVYALVEKIVACIGGTVSYVSRSSDITSLYPKLDIKTGSTGAWFLQLILDLVPDVIYFNGVDAWIINPQATDVSTYDFYFPSL